MTKFALDFLKYDKLFLDKSWEWLHSEPIKSLTDAPEFTRKQQLKWFSGLNNNPSYFIQGIQCNSIPIGVWGLKNITADKAEYFGYIGEIQFWGQGIGKLMVRHALKTAKDLNINCVYLTVLKTNCRALSLYIKTGFQEVQSKNTERLIYMEQML